MAAGAAGRRPLPRSCPLRQSYPDDAPRVTPEPRVAFAGIQSVPVRELTSFGDGTWQVGVDVLPGTYTSAVGPDCRHAFGAAVTGSDTTRHRYLADRRRNA